MPTPTSGGSTGKAGTCRSALASLEVAQRPAPRGARCRGPPPLRPVPLRGAGSLEPGHRPRLLPGRKPAARDAPQRRPLPSPLVPRARRRVSAGSRRRHDAVLSTALAALRPAPPGPGAHRGPLRRLPGLGPGHGRPRANAGPRPCSRRRGRSRLRVEWLCRRPLGARERGRRPAVPSPDAPVPGTGGPHRAAAQRRAGGPELRPAVPGGTPAGRPHERGSRSRLCARPAPAASDVGAGSRASRRARRVVRRDRRGSLGRLHPPHGRAGPPVGASRGRLELREGSDECAAVAASRDRGLAVLLLRRVDRRLPGGLEPGRDGALRGPSHPRPGRDRAVVATAGSAGSVLRRHRPRRLAARARRRHTAPPSPPHVAGLPRPSRSGPLRAARERRARRARGPGARLPPERGGRDRASACPPPPGGGHRPRGLSAFHGAALARPAGADGRRLGRRGLGRRRSRAPGRQGVAPPALAGVDRGLALATANDEDVVVAGGRGRAGGRRPLGLRGDVLLHALGAARQGGPTRRRPRSRGLCRPRPHLRRERSRTLAVGLGPARRPRLSEPRRLPLAAPRPPRPLHAGVLALGPDRARAPRCRCRDLGRRFLATPPRSSLDAGRGGVQPAASPGRAGAGTAGARGPLSPGRRGRGSDPARHLTSWSGGGPPGRRGGASDDRGDDGPTPHLQPPRGPRDRGATSR